MWSSRPAAAEPAEVDDPRLNTVTGRHAPAGLPGAHKQASATLPGSRRISAHLGGRPTIWHGCMIAPNRVRRATENKILLRVSGRCCGYVCHGSIRRPALPRSASAGQWAGGDPAAPPATRHARRPVVAELTTVVSAALRTGGCRGWSIGVNSPDLDPERRSARQIVNFLAEVTGSRCSHRPPRAPPSASKLAAALRKTPALHAPRRDCLLRFGEQTADRSR
jgi:hypothetical protein